MPFEAGVYVNISLICNPALRIHPYMHRSSSTFQQCTKTHFTPGIPLCETSSPATFQRKSQLNFQLNRRSDRAELNPLRLHHHPLPRLQPPTLSRRTTLTPRKRHLPPRSSSRGELTPQRRRLRRTRLAVLLPGHLARVRGAELEERLQGVAFGFGGLEFGS